MSNFHPLEVVDCGSETQLQVGEKLNEITGDWLSLDCVKCYLPQLLPGSNPNNSDEHYILFSR